jgi:GABA(A) receptor-associated protein
MSSLFTAKYSFLKQSPPQIKVEKFIDKHPEEKREKESSRIRLKYPDRIPAIVEKLDNSSLPDIDRKKFLVPKDLDYSQFIFMIRCRLKLAADQALFIYINEQIPSSTKTMGQIDKEYRNKDGFLYATYGSEAVFGNI